MFWWLLLASALLVLYWYKKITKCHKYWEEKQIPHLKPWPLVGNFLPYTLGQVHMLELIQKLYRAFPDSRFFGAYQFLQPILVIKDLDIVKQICIKDFEHFIDHKSFFSETNEPVFSKNLFASKGKEWKELRNTLTPAFTGSKMRTMFTLASDCGERSVNYLTKTIPSGVIKEFKMKELFLKFTIDVIATCAYGIEVNSFEDDNNEFFNVGKIVVDFSGIKNLKSIGFMLCPNIMRFLKMRFFSEDILNYFRNIVSTNIDFREKNGIIRPDLIHLLMEARKGRLKHEENLKDDDAGIAAAFDIKEDEKTNLQITDDLIVAQAMIFFLGGSDTVSTLMSFAVYELALNEDVQRKLQVEIDSVIEQSNGRLTYDKLVKMKYLDMVLSETLRQWPQAFFIDRYCVKSFIIKPSKPGEEEFLIEKGDIVWIPVSGIHKDPKYYSDPDRFNPERFSDENKDRINPYAFLPFGIGPRSCIGNRFALMVAKIFLFYILQKYNIVVTENTKIPVRLSKKQIILDVEDKMCLGLKVRSDLH